jgi:hypothetical protein
MAQTGPKTAQGKEIASRNSFKHGFASQDIVIPGLEDPAEWEELRDSIFESLGPVGGLEANLAERAAAQIWKLRRIERWNTQNITRAVENVVRSAEREAEEIEEAIDEGLLEEYRRDEILTPEQILDKQRMAMMATEHSLGLVMRYEAHLHRQLLQTLHEFEAMQNKRAGGHSPLARLDILGAPVG